MRFKKLPRIIAAVAVIGAVAAGGAAFTASNTIPSSVAGYGTATVSGGTVTALNYTLSSDGTSINSATVVFTGDLSADTVGIGFGGGALQSCGTGTYDGTTSTTFTCTLTGVTTSTASSVAIAVNS